MGHHSLATIPLATHTLAPRRFGETFDTSCQAVTSLIYVHEPSD